MKFTFSDVLKKIIRLCDKVTDAALMLVCISLFLIGVYALYDSYMVYMDANDTGILKYKPGYGSDEEIEKEIKGNMVSWLTIDDTTIDYPIMQGENNTEYLNKDPFGDYALAGSIFLDSRNSSDFSDRYSLIYGHHMEHGMMFGSLDDFLNEEYFKTHQTGTLIVSENEQEYNIRIFAVLEAEATEESIFAPTETDNTIPFLKEHAMYIDDTVVLNDDTKLFAMSTCKYPDTVERTIVFGVLEPKSGSETE